MADGIVLEMQSGRPLVSTMMGTNATPPPSPCRQGKGDCCGSAAEEGCGGPEDGVDAARLPHHHVPVHPRAVDTGVPVRAEEEEDRHPVQVTGPSPWPGRRPPLSTGGQATGGCAPQNRGHRGRAGWGAPAQEGALGALAQARHREARSARLRGAAMPLVPVGFQSPPAEAGGVHSPAGSYPAARGDGADCRTLSGPLSVAWRRTDSNRRPLGYEPSELPNCSTPLRPPSLRCDL